MHRFPGWRYWRRQRLFSLPGLVCIFLLCIGWYFIWNSAWLNEGGEVLTSDQDGAIKKTKAERIKQTYAKFADVKYKHMMSRDHENHDYLLKGVSQDDPRVLSLIRNKYMLYPARSSSGRRVQINSAGIDHSMYGESVFVDGLLNGQSEGFYVEYGAGDGLTFSDSLYLERKRNWTGVLIESNVEDYVALTVNRNANYRIHAGLCQEGNAIRSVYRLQSYPGAGKPRDNHFHNIMYTRSKPDVSEVSIQCFHLYSILKALNVSRVNYFALDIDGPGVSILTMIPFERVTIDVISVRYSQGHGTNQGRALQTLSVLRNLFEATGKYMEAGILPVPPPDDANPEAYGSVIIFYRKSMKRKPKEMVTLKSLRPDRDMR